MLSSTEASSLLREHGLRATAGRVRLLRELARETKPLSIEELGRRLRGSLNGVTLYRALVGLHEAGIVGRSDLRHGHAHYELVFGRPHHHHLVCRSCGLVEDIEVRHASEPAFDALRSSKRFARVDDYALEFFGTCKNCS